LQRSPKEAGIIPADTILHAQAAWARLASTPLHVLQAAGGADKETDADARVGAAPTNAINFADALQLPNVLPYALCFGFFKLVNYCLFFTLPLILADPRVHLTSKWTVRVYIVYLFLSLKWTKPA
jgi:hypothetical protein